MNLIEWQCNSPPRNGWNDSDTHQCIGKIRTPIWDQEFQHHVNIPINRVQDLIRVVGISSRIIYNADYK